MILIAGVGVGLALARFSLAIFRSVLMGGRPIWNWAGGIRGGACLALPMAAATIAVRLRSPRPTAHRLFRQPGWVACLAIVGALGLSLILSLPQILSGRARDAIAINNLLVSIVNIPAIAQATAVAWILLALAGRWRAEPGWIDRLGVFVGAYWILCLVGLAALPLFF